MRIPQITGTAPYLGLPIIAGGHGHFRLRRPRHDRVARQPSLRIPEAAANPREDLLPQPLGLLPGQRITAWQSCEDTRQVQGAPGAVAPRLEPGIDAIDPQGMNIHIQDRAKPRAGPEDHHHFFRAPSASDRNAL